jgi:hypothetical protein
MNYEGSEQSIVDLAWQAWHDGISTAGSKAAIKLFRSDQPVGDEELFPDWLETIDRMMAIALSPEELEALQWLNLDSNEKRERLESSEISFENFVGTIERAIHVMKTGKHLQADKETATKIIVGALSRASKKDVEGVFDVDPGKGLMSSERLVELGISSENLSDSLLLDHRVLSANCIEGEWVVSTTIGEIQFRLVFGDEATGGHS